VGGLDFQGCLAFFGVLYFGLGVFKGWGLRLKDLMPPFARHRDRRQYLRSGGRHLDERCKTLDSKTSRCRMSYVLHLVCRV